jgi:K+-transporting ATPase c subunit
MTKPYVSTVPPDEKDNPSFIDGWLTKWDLKTTLSAAKATEIADAKQTSLRSSSGLDEHLSVAEARDIADVAKAREDRNAQVPHGLFSTSCAHVNPIITIQPKRYTFPSRRHVGWNAPNRIDTTRKPHV